jgi:hypothetical protein
MIPSGLHGCRCSPGIKLWLAALLLFGQATGLAGWEATLSSGQPVLVDPATRRAVIQSGIGQGRPLWDGVHRLQDGSTITIRSGVAIPNAASSRRPPPPTMELGEHDAESGDDSAAAAREPAASPWRTSPPSRGSTDTGQCDHLLLKTCGLQRSCRDADACELAAQLRAMQKQSPQPGLDNSGWAEVRCQEALQDPAGFPACPREPPLHEVACKALAQHVCAGAARCQRTELCRRANALLGFEQSALEREAPEELTLIRRHCSQLLTQHAFFPPCR